MVINDYVSLIVLLTLAFLFPVFVGYFDDVIFNVYQT